MSTETDNTLALPRAQLVRWVREWGSSTSEAVLDTHTRVFHLPDLPGFIGYRLASKHAVVLGDPICPKETREALVSAFHTYTANQKWNTAYVLTSEEFSTWSLKQGCCQAAIHFGSEQLLNPQDNPRRGAKGSLVRRKVRHALKDGVEVKEFTLDDSSIQRQIEGHAHSWLKTRKGPQYYISKVHLFDDPEGKRWFYALKGERVVGVVMLNRLEAAQGWLLNRLMVLPEARGVSELLVVTAVDTVAEEGGHYVTFGATPDEEIGEIIGFNPVFKWLIRFGFKKGMRFFPVQGIRKFWDKFQPTYTPSYFLFRKKNVSLTQFKALLSAFNINI